MFKIFSYKQLAITAFILSVTMLAVAAINTAVPVSVLSGNTINLPIIMYHQISENKAIWGDYVIPYSTLKEDFEYLKKNKITPVSLKQVENFLKNGKPLPHNPIVLTFDDGEKSFLTKVLPLLEKYNYHANINIIGSLVKLYTENGETDDRYAYLNESDITKLYKNPLVELGCHTYNLHSLSVRRGMGKLQGENESQYKKVITEDFENFNALFHRLTGAYPEILAYPYGIRNDLLLATAKNTGFKITLTCRESVNTIKPGDSPYELGRFNRPYGKTSSEFFKEIGL